MLFREAEMAALEALLFVAKEPLSRERLAEILAMNREDVTELIRDLQESYGRDSRGLTVAEVNGGFRLATKPEVAPYIELLYKQPVTGLSAAALEVLSIVAYRQPVTRGEIEFLRGIQSDTAVATLAEKGLIQEVGRKEGPGRPVLFGTTDRFLTHFGLLSLSELPALRFEPAEEAAEGPGGVFSKDAVGGIKAGEESAGEDTAREDTAGEQTIGEEGTGGDGAGVETTGVGGAGGGGVRKDTAGGDGGE
ncbi:Segregation and condensation complex subunit ScpB [Acididesulfobacillus acetoxydans]|uniref:Segregation and condensation protein B n=1 Tax=Acididesulfobacillus acetoxydans TaxID=1561005 RepID=A0A8S0WGP9_9FIRM|nr:Segregation and condensation complex subunit ScpB [Acididesulfobacillus acetoxydans]CEJ08095.1 Segregation and condensation protein B [Acididesulfobacillus acetoxydans]